LKRNPSCHKLPGLTIFGKVSDFPKPHLPNSAGLTYYAYGVGLGTAVRVTGGPDWKDRDTYDIQGVASQDSVERDFRLMVRTMLEERFALKVRVENQTAPNILGLFVDRSDGKLGPNVREWSGTCFNGRQPVPPELQIKSSTNDRYRRCRRSLTPGVRA
jgi:uncharacterized protein (TIGR03435 family)